MIVIHAILRKVGPRKNNIGIFDGKPVGISVPGINDTVAVTGPRFYMRAFAVSASPASFGNMGKIDFHTAVLKIHVIRQERDVSEPVFSEQILNIIIETVRKNQNRNIVAYAVFRGFGKTGSECVFIEFRLEFFLGYDHVRAFLGQTFHRGDSPGFPFFDKPFVQMFVSGGFSNELGKYTVPDIFFRHGAVKINKQFDIRSSHYMSIK